MKRYLTLMAATSIIAVAARGDQVLMPLWQDDVHISGFFLLEPQWTSARLKPLDPYDFESIGGADLELAQVNDLHWNGFALRTRLTLGGNTGQDDWPQTRRLQILEAQWTGMVTDRLKFSVGKRILSWDPGIIAQPLGFFQSTLSLSDVTDEEGVAEGLPLAAATWLGDDWSASLVGSDDFVDRPNGARRGLLQWAGRVTRDFDGADIEAVVQQPQGAPPGFGAGTSGTVGDWLSFHGSLFAGAHRLIDLPVKPDAAQAAIAAPYMPAIVARDPHMMVDGLVGAEISPRDGLAFFTEYYYNNSGFSTAQFNHFVSVEKSADQAVAVGNGLGFADLAMGSSLLEPGMVRQSYLLAQARNQWGNWSGSIADLAGLNDGSALLIGEVSYSPTPHWSLTAAIESAMGTQRAEYGINPVGDVAYLRVRWLY